MERRHSDNRFPRKHTALENSFSRYFLMTGLFHDLKPLVLGTLWNDETELLLQLQIGKGRTTEGFCGFYIFFFFFLAADFIFLLSAVATVTGFLLETRSDSSHMVCR